MLVYLKNWGTILIQILLTLNEPVPQLMKYLTLLDILAASSRIIDHWPPLADLPIARVTESQPLLGSITAIPLMNSMGNNARQEDTGSIRYALRYISHTSDNGSALQSPRGTPKSSRGLNHRSTPRLLCPMERLEEFDADPAPFVSRVQTFPSLETLKRATSWTGQNDCSHNSIHFNPKAFYNNNIVKLFESRPDHPWVVETLACGKSMEVPGLQDRPKKQRKASVWKEPNSSDDDAVDAILAQWSWEVGDEMIEEDVLNDPEGTKLPIIADMIAKIPGTDSMSHMLQRYSDQPQRIGFLDHSLTKFNVHLTQSVIEPRNLPATAETSPAPLAHSLTRQQSQILVPPSVNIIKEVEAIMRMKIFCHLGVQTSKRLTRDRETLLIFATHESLASSPPDFCNT
ncbi:hypothetical protein BU17DRAFT_70772 [Hysterangium stoloniferum]|nr:hypothetical protein BU17DRAFT_70772 [Hysterangium stoloniferum]